MIKHYGNPLVALMLLGLLASAASATNQKETAAKPATPLGSGSASASVSMVTLLPASFSVVRVAGGQADLPVLVVNNNLIAAEVSVVPLLTDANGRAFNARLAWVEEGKELTGPQAIGAGKTRRPTLRIRPENGAFNHWWDSRLPLRGHLDVRTKPADSSSGASTSGPREISIAQIQPSTVEVVVLFASLVVAIGVVFVTATTPAADLPKGQAAATADSLASRVGLGAGLLNALLALASLPVLTTFATRETYALLAAVFAALIAMGAPLSNLLGTGPGNANPVSKASFKSAAFMVLWGGLGQMAVGALLVRELHNAGAIAVSSQWLLLALIGGVAVAVLTFVRKAVANPQVTVAPSSGVNTFKVASPTPGTGWSVP